MKSSSLGIFAVKSVEKLQKKDEMTVLFCFEWKKANECAVASCVFLQRERINGVVTLQKGIFENFKEGASYFGGVVSKKLFFRF